MILWRSGLTRQVVQDLHPQYPGISTYLAPLLSPKAIANYVYRIFPPNEIKGVIFQDAGPLENDLLISALSEVAAMYPLVEEPDFIVSLGTGTPRIRGKLSMSASGPLRLWKDRAVPRLYRLFWEKMRDRQVKQAFRTHPRYYCLDIEFDGAVLRLDDT